MRRQLSLLQTLIARDLQLFFADRRAAALCFLVPVILGSLFGMIFDTPGKGVGKVKLPLVVVVEDDSPLSQGIVADLIASENIDATFANRQEAERKIERRRFGVGLLLPKGFGAECSRGLRAGEKPALQLWHHPLSTLEAEWAEGALSEILIKRLARDILAPLGIPAERAMERPFAVSRHAIPAESHGAFNSYTHSFCGMALQYLLFWGMECGLLFLRERQRGIWNRVRMAPVPVWISLTSRVASSTLIGLLQIGVTFGFGYVAFGVEIRGSFVGFVLLAICVSLLAASAGLLVATMSGTEARARNVSILVILALSMLGGLWLPAFLLPPWVQEISLATPTSWAMRGMDAATWQGQPLSAVLPSCGMLLTFAAGATLFAWHRLAQAENSAKKGFCT